MHQKNNLPILGIIAGRGLLPSEIAKLYTSKSALCYIAALENETDLELIRLFPNKLFKLGEVGALIEYFTKHDVKTIVFVGGIDRPNFSSIKVDLIGASLMAQLLKQKFFGDDNLLKVVASFFEKKGFNVISAQEILRNLNESDLNGKTHQLSNIAPSKQDLIDIELGIKVLDSLGLMDVGQSVIVENGYVLGIEAAEGTDNLIKRCALLRKKTQGGVLVKMMKQDQDNRMDIPIIGPDTIANLIDNKYHGLAIQKDGVIIFQSKKVIELSNNGKIFLVKI